MPTFPTSPEAWGMVRVHPQLRGQVECHIHAGETLLKQMPEAQVGLFHSVIAGILAHGPQAPAIHIRANPPRERVAPREAHIPKVVTVRYVLRCV